MNEYDIWDDKVLMGFVDKGSIDINAVYNHLEPIWKDCKRVPQDIKVPLIQIHTHVIKSYLDKIRINRKRDKIMERLRQEEVERRGYKDESELCLYYPHNLVDEEYPVRPLYFISFCDKDKEVLKHTAKIAVIKFTDSDIFHVEGMVHYMDYMIPRLKRRQLIG